MGENFLIVLVALAAPLLPVAFFAILVLFAAKWFPPGDDSRTDWVACLLSVPLPGAGHIYKGYVGTGMVLMYINFFAAGSRASLLWGLIHLGVIFHATRLATAEKTVAEPERALCSRCGGEFLESELTSHAGKLWCAKDYGALFATG